MSRSEPTPSSPEPQFNPQRAQQHAPICKSCGNKMRPTKVEPHARLRNINVRTLACDCGIIARDVVPHLS